jgi:hypothetical protein
MSIKYNVSQDGLRIETFPEGVLDFQKTIDYFERLKIDNRIKKGAIEIVNFNKVTDYKISYLESEKITQTYQSPKETQIIDATIFLCETELAFGIGRMLQTFHEIANPNHKVMVVKSEGELEDVIKTV